MTMIVQHNHFDGSHPETCIGCELIALRARVSYLESLTDGVDWEQWYDASEILSSQQTWKGMAERYKEALSRIFQGDWTLREVITIAREATAPPPEIEV